ncbi:MAG: GNAT family N-acetyltransferase [Bacteroidetes bacterium]|nr:GNAT family N-acetyltransferase [Bacteroidota bacterium]
MIIREAQIKDIDALHKIRIAVRENILPDPSMITTNDYTEFLTKRGKGWLCETNDEVAGFAIVDLVKNNIWALFVAPLHEGKGIGKKLHDAMLDWYFIQTTENIWLGTSPDTRAEKFYRRAGWKAIGKRPNGEIHFEMSAKDWQESRM